MSKPNKRQIVYLKLRIAQALEAKDISAASDFIYELHQLEDRLVLREARRTEAKAAVAARISVKALRRRKAECLKRSKQTIDRNIASVMRSEARKRAAPWEGFGNRD